MQRVELRVEGLVSGGHADVAERGRRGGGGGWCHPIESISELCAAFFQYERTFEIDEQG